LVDQLFLDWRQRWFPGPLRSHSDRVLLLLFDRELRAVHRLPDPPARLVRVAPPVVRGYLALQGARPHRLDRSWADHFISERSTSPDFAKLGHQGGTDL
jgi:hypothetical protein